MTNGKIVGYQLSSYSCLSVIKQRPISLMKNSNFPRFKKCFNRQVKLLSRQLKFTTAFSDKSQKNLNRKNIILRFNIVDSSKDFVRYGRNTSYNVLYWKSNLGGLGRTPRSRFWADFGQIFWSKSCVLFISKDIPDLVSQINLRV